MIKISNIKKSFGSNHVIKGVDLEVNKGDIIVIIGPSGSGKTTLLRSIDFLETADEGSIEFDEIKTEFKKATKKQIVEDGTPNEVFYHPKEERTKEFLKRVYPQNDYVI